MRFWNFVIPSWSHLSRHPARLRRFEKTPFHINIRQTILNLITIIGEFFWHSILIERKQLTIFKWPAPWYLFFFHQTNIFESSPLLFHGQIPIWPLENNAGVRHPYPPAFRLLRAPPGEHAAAEIVYMFDTNFKQEITFSFPILVVVYQLLTQPNILLFLFV